MQPRPRSLTLCLAPFALVAVAGCGPSLIDPGAHAGSDQNSDAGVGDGGDNLERGTDAHPSLGGAMDFGSNHGDGGGGGGGGDGGGPACNDPLDQAGCGCPMAGSSRACYTGPPATRNVGTCMDGMQVCQAQGEFATWGPCTGSVLPAKEDCVNKHDTNCNGQSGCDDIACAGMAGCCNPGDNRACYDGPPGTRGMGQCGDGFEVCLQNGAWDVKCSGEKLPGVEAGHCGDGIDNDCNGLIDCKDPACFKDPLCVPKVCPPGQMKACYNGPPGTAGIGICRPGTMTCDKNGQWLPCVGEVLPGVEAGNCGDGLDNDCNGLIDCKDPACKAEPHCIPPDCLAGAMRSCYDGPNGTAGVGICRSGMEACTQQGKWSGICVGEVLPGAEFLHCNDKLDNDCNGFTDCADLICLLDPVCQPPVCQANANRPCYDGPNGTNNVGACRPGTQTCAQDGSGWGNCVGEVVPGMEAGHCKDGIDNDCNGLTDCADPACFADPACCTPVTMLEATIYATSGGTLYTIDPKNWSEHAAGNYDTQDQMTDIAMTPDGKLYTISGTALYAVDPNTAHVSKIAAVGGDKNNALTFLVDNTLLAADAGGTLKKIDPQNGKVAIIGQYGQGYGSSGDLVAIGDGTMFGISATDALGNDISSDNLLITVNTQTGKATEVGHIGLGNVFGMAYYGGHVIGFDYVGEVIEIDPKTGAGMLLSKQNNHWFGGTTSPTVPVNGCI